MKRTHIIALMALVVAIPAAAASSFFATTAKTSGKISGKPCFAAGNAGYEISADTTPNYTVRIDNAAASPNLRMQIVDDPAAADFVLVDDGDTGAACEATTAINTIRIDPQSANPDLTVVLVRTNAAYRIYVHSVNYTEQDAAALFAVIWQNTIKKTARTAAAVPR